MGNDARCISCHRAIPAEAIFNAHAHGNEAKFCSSKCRVRHHRLEKNLQGYKRPSSPTEEGGVGYEVLPGADSNKRLAWYVDFNPNPENDDDKRRYSVPRDFDPEIACRGEVAILTELARRHGSARVETPEVEVIKPDLRLGNVLDAIHAPLPPGATPPTREQLEGFIDALREAQKEAGMRVSDDCMSPTRDGGYPPLRAVGGRDYATPADAGEDRSGIWEEVDIF